MPLDKYKAPNSSILNERSVAVQKWAVDFKEKLTRNMAPLREHFKELEIRNNQFFNQTMESNVRAMASFDDIFKLASEEAAKKLTSLIPPENQDAIDILSGKQMAVWAKNRGYSLSAFPLDKYLEDLES